MDNIPKKINEPEVTVTEVQQLLTGVPPAPDVQPEADRPVAAHSASPANTFCAGIGQYHTNEADPKIPDKKLKPYNAITRKRIEELVDAPQEVEKSKAEWFIPSTLPSRTFEHQRDNGQFGYLAADLDKFPKSLKVVSNNVSIITDGANYEVYSSRSATEENQKGRVLVPLANLLNHDDWRDAQAVFFDKLKGAGHECDVALLRAAQLVYLPNKGKWYFNESVRWSSDFDPMVAWADEIAAERADRVSAEVKAKATADARHKRAANRAGGPTTLDNFNATTDVSEILLRNDYEECTRRPGNWRHPDSESGNYSLQVLEDGKVFGLSSSDPLGRDKNDGHALSPFDVLMTLEHAGDFAKTFEAVTGAPPHEKESAAEAFGLIAAAGEVEPPKALVELLNRWEWEAGALFGLPNGLGLVDRDAVAVVWRRCAVTGKAAAQTFHILDADGKHHQYSRGDFVQAAVPEIFGRLTTPAFDAALENALVGLNRTERTDLRKKAAALGLTPLVKKLIVQRNATEMAVRVDMFSQRGRFDIEGSTLVVTLPFKLFPAADFDPGIVADYKDHFPQFDEVLDAMLHARFAGDRKEAYIWLHAVSDWGKGFLLSIFKNLGIATELSVGVINKIIGGETVAVSSSEMVHAWAIFVDEWKGASRELKQLNSEMAVAAKYANRIVVQLYLKVFMSAEDVASLTGEGVEEQFNNRFAYLSPTPVKINDRPMFMDVGKTAYMAAVVAYAAAHLNHGVEAMRTLGEANAAKRSDKWLNDFRKRHLLSAEFGSLNDSLEEQADEIREVLRAYGKNVAGHHTLDVRTFCGTHGLDLGVTNLLIRSAKVVWLKDNDGAPFRGLLLKKPPSFVKAYLNQRAGDKSTAGKLSYKGADIAKLIHEPITPVDAQGRITVYGHGEQPLAAGTRERAAAVEIA